MNEPPASDDQLEEVPDPAERRRRTDKLTLAVIWDKALMFVAVGLAVWSVVSVQGKADRAEVAATSTQIIVSQQKVGRRVALDILCGGLYGVERAGRLTILDRLPPPAPKAHPQTPVETKQRLLFAQAYAEVISDAVIQQAGVEIKDVLRHDGTIDCEALKKAARAAGG